MHSKKEKFSIEIPKNQIKISKAVKCRQILDQRRHLQHEYAKYITDRKEPPRQTRESHFLLHE